MGRVTARAVHGDGAAAQYRRRRNICRGRRRSNRAAGAAPRPRAAAAPQPQQAKEAPQRVPQARVQPIDPDLPPDQPLEPGSGPPRQRVGARIAARQRRSARRPPRRPPRQIRVSSPPPAAPRKPPCKTQPRAQPKLPSERRQSADEAPRGLMKRMKSLFVAASIVAIAVGAVQIGGKFLIGGSRASPVKSARANACCERPCRSPRPITMTPRTRTSAAAAPASPLAPALTAPSTHPHQPDADRSRPCRRCRRRWRRRRCRPHRRRPPRPTSPARSRRRAMRTRRAPSVCRPRSAAPKLRSAALGGNAAAAYEIAVRYAEGRGVPANAEEAARWYERAAGKGVALAQFRSPAC